MRRWALRVAADAPLMTDAYPSFRAAETDHHGGDSRDAIDLLRNPGGAMPACHALMV
jgi:hypothetical protein